MAIIPEFDRKKLASSVVGTPGVDPSGQIASNAISDSAGQIANTAFKIAADRQQARDTAMASKNAVELDRDLEMLWQKHQNDFSEFRGDPGSRVKAFEESANQLFQNKLSSIESSKVRNYMVQYGTKTVGEKVLKETDAALKNQEILVHNDITDSANILAQQAATLWGETGTDTNAKLGRTTEILMKSRSVLDGSRQALSSENQYKLSKAMPEMILKAAVAGGLEKNPDQILNAINNGAFDQYLKPEEIQKIKKDATEAIPKLQKTIQFDNMINEAQDHLDLWGAWKSGDKTVLQKIENMPETDFTRSMRELILKGSSDPSTSADTIVRLQNKFMSFLDAKGKNVKAASTLEDMRGFMKEVVDARTRGDLTDSQADTFLKKLAQPVYERIKESRSNSFSLDPRTWFSGAGLYTNGYKTIDAWVTANGFKKDSEVKAAVYLDFIDLMQKDPNPTKESMITHANEAVDRYVRGTNPSVGLLKQVPDRILKTTGQMVNAVPSSNSQKSQVPVSAKAVAVKKRRIQKKSGEIFDQWLDKDGSVLEERKVANA